MTGGIIKDCVTIIVSYEGTCYHKPVLSEVIQCIAICYLGDFVYSRRGLGSGLPTNIWACWQATSELAAKPRLPLPPLHFPLTLRQSIWHEIQ